MLINLRKIGLNVFPLLVVVWATFAILGGAVYLTAKSDAVHDSVSTAGMGLCAATVALLINTSTSRKRKALPMHMPSRLPLAQNAPLPAAYRAPVLSTAPLPQLQTFRI